MSHPAIDYLKSLGYAISDHYAAQPPGSHHILTYELNGVKYQTTIRTTDGVVEVVDVDKQNGLAFIWEPIDLSTDQITIDSMASALDYKSRLIPRITTRNYRLLST